MTAASPDAAAPSLDKLPKDGRAERAILGSMFVSPGLIQTAAEMIVPEDFYYLRNQIIFRTVCAMAARSEAVDLVTVESRLKLDGQLDEVGGFEYIAKLWDVIPTSANLEHYIARVRERAVRRRLGDAARAVLASLGDSEIETPDLLERTERALAEISKTVSVRPYHHIRDVVTEAYQTIEGVHERQAPIIGLPVGLVELDKILSGFQNSDLIILGARPSVGKTALALTIANNVGLLKAGAVLFFSLEMARVQLAIRMISMESGVNQQALRAGQFKDSRWDEIITACGMLSDQHVIIDDSSEIGLREIRTKVRRAQAEHGVRLVIVDYLQLMQATGKKNSTRQDDVAQLSRGLKLLAKEFNIPVLVLAQLSRKLEDRGDKRPQLSDLRESGAIEQDADVVLFLHREERYTATSENKGHAEIIVAKQRNGPIGCARQMFDETTGRFGNHESLAQP